MPAQTPRAMCSAVLAPTGDLRPLREATQAEALLRQGAHLGDTLSTRAPPGPGVSSPTSLCAAMRRQSGVHVSPLQHGPSGHLRCWRVLRPAAGGDWSLAIVRARKDSGFCRSRGEICALVRLAGWDGPIEAVDIDRRNELRLSLSSDEGITGWDRAIRWTGGDLLGCESRRRIHRDHVSHLGYPISTPAVDRDMPIAT